ncbi:MAG: phage protein [Magnetococcales bacterium]|nr:phage protein [Magnetococcales bacterium]HIJ83065.1 BrnT family toxin [Magnetococcales bacterium]
MEIEFDPAKDVVNLKKHGESLRLAKYLDWGSSIFAPDRRRDYGELRMIGYAPFEDGRLYCVVFVDRNNVRRIVSLRKANSREVRDYVNARAIDIYPNF